MSIKPFSPEDAQRVREFFAISAYDEENVLSVSPGGIPPSIPEGGRADYEAQLGEWSPFHCLALWFFSGKPVGEKESSGVIPEWFVDVCAAHGLLERRDGQVMPHLLVTPCEDLWIASDLHRQRSSGSAGDHILPLNLPARHLCRFLIRRPVGSGLDLCSGNGLHAMILGGFCDRVSTADLSPRSESYCHFNAALNGRAPVSCHTGDRFEPLAGQTFDTIVCNPPFVITPAGEAKYHANSMELDGFCRQLLRAAPPHLNEGGLCQMMCEWVRLPGQSWQDRLATWWEGLGCDVWVILANTQSPENYARTRALDGELSPAAQTARQAAWLEYLQKCEVQAIHGGIITVRRRERGPHWQRMDELEDNIYQPVGEAMAQMMAAEDFLQARPGAEDLLDWRPRVASWTSLDQAASWSGQGWEVQSTVIRARHELTAPLQIDESVLRFLSDCQGKTTLEEHLMAIAASVGAPPEAMRGDFLNLARSLVKRGLLIP